MKLSDGYVGFIIEFSPLWYVFEVFHNKKLRKWKEKWIWSFKALPGISKGSSSVNGEKCSCYPKVEGRTFLASGYWKMSFKQLGKNVGVIQWPHVLLYMTIHESDINPWMRKNRGKQPKKSLGPLRNWELCFVKESVQKMIRMSENQCAEIS